MQIDLIQIATMSGAIMGIVGLGAWIKKVIERAMKPIRDIAFKVDKHNDALRSVLKNNITRTYLEFVSRGKIGHYALQSVLEMYEQYKALGGNNFIDEIISELKKLPIDLEKNK
jgi:hypothetical protein